MKVLMVTDTPNWAWMRKAKAIQRCLNDDFKKITVIHLKQFHKGLMEKYHHVHFFGWMDRRKIAGKYKGLTAGVSSHNFEYRHPEKARVYLPKFSAITANSMLIYNKLKEWNLNKHIYYTPNGVDEEEFCPNPTKHDKFVVGWTGQPSGKGLTREGGLDMHGYHNVLLPLVESLKDEKDIEFKIMTNTSKNAVPYSEMPKFYNSLDLFVHTGFGTGTPNPAFEAAACGVPVISTAIGAIPELIVDGQNGFKFERFYNKKDAIIRIDDMREAILYMYNHDDSRLQMGKSIRRCIEKDWTWKQRSQAWKKMFMEIYKKI